MKKIFTLIAVAAFALSMNAEIYIVGNDPFGGWDTSNGMVMNDNGDGTYSLTVELSGDLWFVFADNLTENPGEWDLFNSEYRFGPTTGVDQKVTLGDYIATQKQGNGDGAYQLACGTETSSFTFTFDAENMEFIVEGDAHVDPDWTYATVAGSAASVFGTTWDPSNTENDMTMNEDGIFVLDKYNCLLEEGNLEFKIASNHGWGLAVPGENYQYYIEQPGYYDLQFTFDTATYEINVITELVDSIPPEPIEAMYVLGEVNGNTWLPNMGVAMTTEDMVNYTIDVEATGEKVDAEDGQTYSFFSFTSKLAEGAEDWGAISGSRLGAIVDGCLVSEDMLGMPLSLIKGENSFKVPSGKKYTLAVNVENLDAMTVTITEKSDGVDELAAGKTVSDVRYFNVMGQEMSEANGVTIVVTRYTDGSTTAAKVIK
mgnify:CR=1 FL=1